MHYWRVLVITIILALATFWTIAWANKPEVINTDSTGSNIIAFGDSLVFGTGSTPGNDMFSIVSKETGVPIINKGVPGDTTEDGLNRLESDILNNNPRIVFVLFGGNDYLRKVPKETTFKNLKTIIERIQERGAAVILMGVRGGVFIDRFEEDYQDLAKEYKTGYVPNVLEGLITNRQYMYDSIHPNDKGYYIVALRIIPVLELILNR